MARAEKLLDERQDYDDGSILALRLWRVPSPVPPATHVFKYALFYGRPGERLVLFDNERGKGNASTFWRSKPRMRLCRLRR